MGKHSKILPSPFTAAMATLARAENKPIYAMPLELNLTEHSTTELSHNCIDRTAGMHKSTTPFAIA